MIMKKDISSKDIKLVQDSGLFDIDYYLANYKKELNKDEKPLEHFLYSGWQKGNNPSAKFSVNYYLKRYPEARKLGVNPLLHYLHEGKDQGYFPSQFVEQLAFVRKTGEFDEKYYLENNKNINLDNEDPLHHFMRIGWKEGRNPNTTFDLGYYLSHYQDLKASDLNPFFHYVRFGKLEGRFSSQLAKDITLVRESGLFDFTYYRKQSSILEDEDSLEHFLRVGWRENLNPSPNFHTKYYLSLYGDEIGGTNPLLHYLYEGKEKGYFPTKMVEDLAIRIQDNLSTSTHSKGQIALSEFVKEIVGIVSSDHFSYYFDIEFYSKQLNRKFHDELEAKIHYIEQGFLRDYDPSPIFSTKFYMDKYKDVSLSHINPLVHYIIHGVKEYRSPHPLCDFKYVNSMHKDFISPTNKFKDVYIEILESKSSLFISSSYLFDSHLYFSQLSSLDKKSIDYSYLKHYLLFGWQGKHQPHCLFDNEFYNVQYKLLVGKSLTSNPYVHYLLEGYKMNLSPHPFFDQNFYCWESYSGSENPLIHFLKNNHKFKSTTPLIDLPYFNHVNSEVLQDSDGNQSLILNYLFQPNKFKYLPHKYFNEEVLLQLAECFNMGEDLSAHEILRNVVYDLRLWNFGLKHASTTYLNEFFPEENTLLPKVSVVILNYNKFIFTLQCVYFLIKADVLFDCELVIFDNGSDPNEFEHLLSYIPNHPRIQIVRSDQNRFFGEGNNLALNYCKGNNILFLNNDVFVRGNTIKELLDFLETSAESLAGVGPCFLSPDKRIQEIGGTVSRDGSVIQHGKSFTWEEVKSVFGMPRKVDYISAACFLVRKKVIEEVGGFDYLFEPFYYEDTDICQRIILQGYHLMTYPTAQVFHLENVSTKELLGNTWMSTVSKNRRRFAERWLQEQSSEELHPWCNKELVKSNFEQTAGVYSPFPLQHGGGEKYILTVAQGLSERFNTFFISLHRYSKAKINMVARDLDVNIDNITFLTYDEAISIVPFDIFVSMGNEIVPACPALGKKSFFHCQFPFPLRNVGHYGFDRLSNYNAFIVNSEYTKENIVKTLQVYRQELLPVHVCAPPINKSKYQETKLLPSIDDLSKSRPLRVISVGRFIRHGHCKCQNIIVEIIKKLEDSLQVPCQLDFCGSVSTHSDDQSYLNDIIEMAKEMNINFHVPASRQKLLTLYNQADIYIHATGYNVTPLVFPERMEHFGITVVEAMMYGCVPFVIGQGGPKEIVSDGINGYHFLDIDEAAYKILHFLELPSDARMEIHKAAIDRSNQFEVQKFVERIQEVVKY